MDPEAASIMHLPPPRPSEHLRLSPAEDLLLRVGSSVSFPHPLPPSGCGGLSELFNNMAVKGIVMST